jgi:cell wall-associated NlpC family hydrolase
VGPATRAFNISSMLIGDPIFYDWYSDGIIDHVAISVGYASDSQTLIDAHTSNKYHVRWDLIAYTSTTLYQDKFWNTITY